MHWTFLDTWIVVAGALSAGSCALLGAFLVLRRMSMMGDAISHAVLPGLAIAFIATGSRDSLIMFVGAGVVGLLTAFFTQWLHQLGKVEQNAAMGVVFTSLFAVGLILMVRGADSVDLDPGCVLYGAIELVPLDTVSVGGWPVPRAVVSLTVMFAIDLLFVALFFKELRISSFDPELATTLGFNASVMHYALMALVAATTVAAFESVGSILVIAMLIVPGATAYLLTDRLGPMLALSVGLAMASAWLGHVGAITVPTWFGYEDTNTAGMIAVVIGAVFLVVALGAPRQGIISRMLGRRKLAGRVVREDVLGLAYRVEELRGRAALKPEDVSEALMVGRGSAKVALNQLVKQGHLSTDGRAYELAETGRTIGRDLIRSHRLWEAWLAENLKLPVDQLHRPAERLEHVTDRAMQKRLEAAADHPTRDPQGKRIPPAEG